MQYPQRILCCEGISSDDEIDALFNKLQQIEPPPSLLEHILSSVSRLSKIYQPQVLAPLSYGESEGLLVHNENNQPS
jgi:hypothetical protein